jgi:hypothetical protein
MSSCNVLEDSLAFTSMYYGDSIEIEDVKFSCLELRRSLQAHLPGSLTFTCDVMPQVGWLVGSSIPRILPWPTRNRASTSHVYKEIIILPSHLESLLITLNTASECCFVFGMSWLQISAVLSEVSRSWKPRCHFLLIASQFGIVYPVVFMYTHQQGCTDHGRHVLAAKFCIVAPNVCWNSVQTLIHVNFMAPWVWMWLLQFWKICAPLPANNWPSNATLVVLQSTLNYMFRLC